MFGLAPLADKKMSYSNCCFPKFCPKLLTKGGPLDFLLRANLKTQPRGTLGNFEYRLKACPPLEKFLATPMFA